MSEVPKLGDLSFCESSRQLSIARGPGIIYFADLATSLQGFQDISPVVKPLQGSESGLQVEWTGVTTVIIKRKFVNGKIIILESYSVKLEWCVMVE